MTVNLFCQLYVGAIQRKYESMRRQWVVEGKENSADLMETQAKVNKYHARRIRVSCRSVFENS